MKVPASLSTVLRVASVFDRDVSVMSDAEGWKVNCMDPAHISMASMTIPAEQFDDPTDTGTYTPAGLFGLRIKDIEGLVPKARTMEVADGNVVLRGSNWVRTTRIIMAEEGRMAPMPDLPASVMLDSDALRPILKEFDPKSAPEVRLSLDTDGLTLDVGDEKGSMSMTVPADDTLGITCNAPVSAAYALDYWQEFVKALPKGAVAEIALDSDYPAVVTFGEEGMSGRWVIAPRISGDE